MNFKIAEKPAFSVIGAKYVFRDNDDYDENQIAGLWKMTPPETLDKLKALSKNGGLFGMFTRHYLGTTEYLIAAESDADLPPDFPPAETLCHGDISAPKFLGFVKHKVAACKWVVVENPAEASDLSERVYTEWMPGSGYSRAARSFPSMELYGEFYKTGNTYNELWIPVDSAEDVKRKFDGAKAELANVEATATGTPANIDLRTVIPDADAVKEGLQVSYTPEGRLVIFAPTSGNGLVGTPQSFAAPLKIEMRAKTDSTNLRIYYGRSTTNYWGAWMHLNGAMNDGEFYDGENLSVSDLSVENYHTHENATRIPINEFIDIEWIFAKTVMAIKINGEVRVASTEYEYIEAFKNGFAVSSPVYPAAGRGSTITVERLRITEL